jgi:hypothetical protein
MSGIASRAPIPPNGIASHVHLDGLPIAVQGEVKSRTIEPQSAVFKEGQPAGAAYRIVSGEISTIRLNAATGKTQALERLSPGAYFGEAAFLGSGRRTATALASARTLVLEMDARAFEAELSSIEENHRAVLWLLLEFTRKVPPAATWPAGLMPEYARPLIAKMAATMAGTMPELTQVPGAFLRGLYAHLVDAAIARLP